MRMRGASNREDDVELTIVGKIYVNAPVSSNITTTTVTVILMTPLSAAAAPRKA